MSLRLLKWAGPLFTIQNGLIVLYFWYSCTFLVFSALLVNVTGSTTLLPLPNFFPTCYKLIEWRRTNMLTSWVKEKKTVTEWGTLHCPALWSLFWPHRGLSGFLPTFHRCSGQTSLSHGCTLLSWDIKPLITHKKDPTGPCMWIPGQRSHRRRNLPISCILVIAIL